MNQRFAKKLQTLQSRVSELRSHAPKPSDAGGPDVWQELTTALEELQVAEEELRQQNEELAAAQIMLERGRRRYAELFDQAPDGKLVTDGTGTIREANRQAAAMIGVPKPFLPGKSLLIYLPLDDQRFVSSQLAILTQDDAASFWEDEASYPTCEVKLSPRSGDALDIDLRIAKLHWEEEGRPSLLWTLRDVTPKKQAEEALRRSEELYRLLAENASDLISRHDKDGVFLYASPACKRLLGYASAEIVGRSLYEFAHQDDLDALHDSHQELLSGSKRYTNCEYRLLHKGGAIYHVETALKTVITLDSDDSSFIAVTRDITARKKAEEELQRSEEQLKAAIQEVMRDTSWFAQSVVEKLIESRKTPTKKVGLQFTRREQQVLERIAKGFTNVEIAQDLGIATQTVRNYVAAVYDKIGANTRAQAVVWARERGLVGP